MTVRLLLTRKISRETYEGIPFIFPADQYWNVYLVNKRKTDIETHVRNNITDMSVRLLILFVLYHFIHFIYLYFNFWHTSALKYKVCIFLSNNGKSPDECLIKCKGYVQQRFRLARDHDGCKPNLKLIK